MNSRIQYSDYLAFGDRNSAFLIYNASGSTSVFSLLRIGEVLETPQNRMCKIFRQETFIDAA